MRTTLAALVLMLCMALSFPAAAAENKHGIGIGVNTGFLDNDELDEEFDFVGGMVFGKIGFTDNWGLLISLRTMTDDEDLPSDMELEYLQFGVHAVYMWRPDMKVRPHVKFGLAFTDLEANDVPDPFSPIIEDFSDDGVGASIGGGLEAGSQRVAFYGDYDITVVELFEEDSTIANLTLGVIFRF